MANFTYGKRMYDKQIMENETELQIVKTLSN